MAQIPNEIVFNDLPKIGTIFVTVRLGKRAAIRIWAGHMFMRLGAWLMFCNLDFQELD